LYIQNQDEKNGGGRRRWNGNRGEIKKFEIGLSFIRPSIIVKPKIVEARKKLAHPFDGGRLGLGIGGDGRTRNIEKSSVGMGLREIKWRSVGTRSYCTNRC
jgi:hypothetical protein